MKTIYKTLAEILIGLPLDQQFIAELMTKSFQQTMNVCSPICDGSSANIPYPVLGQTST